MITISILVGLLIPVIIICCLALPIIIGVAVYKDAKKRDTNPWLWALVAALVPSFVGLIVYLIIRNDYAVIDGTQQNNVHEENHDSSDDTNYEYTTYTNSEGQTYTQTSVPSKQGLPTWAKTLIIIGVIVVALCIIASIIMLGVYLFGYSNSVSPYYFNGSF